MRSIDPAIQAKFETQYGSQPTPIVKIGSNYYAGDVFTISGFGTTQARLLEIGTITSQLTTKNSASVGSVSVKLDDSDGVIRTLLNGTNLNYLPAEVYLYYPGLTSSQVLKVHNGVIQVPINWTEGQRELTFDITTPLDTVTVGYNIQDGDISPVTDKSLIGQSLPVVVGKCHKVAAVKITNLQHGSLINPIWPTSSTIYVDGAENFLRDTTLTLSIGGLLMEGQFNDPNIKAKFNVTTRNKPYYTNVALGIRDTGDPDHNTQSPNFPYSMPASIFWLANDEKIAGKYICVTYNGKVMPNFVYRQVGKKCWCKWEFLEDGDTSLKVFLGPGQTIDTVTPQIPVERLSDPYFIAHFFMFHWSYPAGTTVTRADDLEAKYVVNVGTTSSIAGVWAYRTPKNAVKFLSLVPSHYYTKNLNDTTTLQSSGAPAITTITFSRPLSYCGEGWEDDTIYVSLDTGTGSNTAVQLQYLIEQFSALSVDATSFNTVAAAIANYPSNFVVTDSRPLLDVLQDVAWQARCGISLDGTTFKLSYLSKKPVATVADIDETGIEFGSINVSVNDQDLTTRMIGTYRIGALEEPQRIVKSKNTNLYGIREQTYDFWIYNIRSCVEKSMNFWLNRYSTLYKSVSLKGLPQSTALEVFDAVGITLASNYFGTANTQFTTVVQQVSMNLVSLDVGLTLWVPIILGTTTEDSSAWLSDVGDTLPVLPFENVESTFWIQSGNTNSSGESAEGNENPEFEEDLDEQVKAHSGDNTAGFLIEKLRDYDEEALADVNYLGTYIGLNTQQTALTVKTSKAKLLKNPTNAFLCYAKPLLPAAQVFGPYWDLREVGAPELDIAYDVYDYKDDTLIASAIQPSMPFATPCTYKLDPTASYTAIGWYFPSSPTEFILQTVYPELEVTDQRPQILCDCKIVSGTVEGATCDYTYDVYDPRDLETALYSGLTPVYRPIGPIKPLENSGIYRGLFVLDDGDPKLLMVFDEQFDARIVPFIATVVTDGGTEGGWVDGDWSECNFTYTITDAMANELAIGATLFKPRLSHTKYTAGTKGLVAYDPDTTIYTLLEVFDETPVLAVANNITSIQYDTGTKKLQIKKTPSLVFGVGDEDASWTDVYTAVCEL